MFKLLLAIPAVRYALGGLALIAALWGVKAYVEHAAYKRGTSDMKAAIEKQDTKAADAAAKAVLSVDACFDAGREWLQREGRCGE